MAKVHLRLKVTSNAEFRLTQNGVFCKRFKSLEALINEVKALARSAYENQECGFEYLASVIITYKRSPYPFERKMGITEVKEQTIRDICSLEYTSDGEFNINWIK